MNDIVRSTRRSLTGCSKNKYSNEETGNVNVFLY